ncbi:Uncharacterised protein [Klebsiella pneumoniae]|uniref:Uncharacterized protein n=1 Tax=Klebsiella pneumoniae TaxID=573 RepID=A0A377TFQ7_KLEPN|nr:Uncharacterised protein [Klebsiella pneumoniae]
MFLDADDDVSEGFIYNRYIQASSHNADVLLSNAGSFGMKAIIKNLYIPTNLMMKFYPAMRG